MAHDAVAAGAEAACLNLFGADPRATPPTKKPTVSLGWQADPEPAADAAAGSSAAGGNGAVAEIVAANLMSGGSVLYTPAKRGLPGSDKQGAFEAPGSQSVSQSGPDTSATSGGVSFEDQAGPGGTAPGSPLIQRIDGSGSGLEPGTDEEARR